MRILLISHTGELGGAGNMLVLLAKGLKTEHEVFCVMPDFHHGLAEKMFADGISMFKHRLNDNIGKVNKDIDNIIYENKIELVITNTCMVVDGAEAAKKANIPHIWWVHEIVSADYDLKKQVNPETLYPYLHNTGKIVAISEAVRREVGEATVIHNGIPVLESTVNICVDPVVMSAGGMCQRKGQMVLLRAMKGVIDAIPEAKLISYGGHWDKLYYWDVASERRKLQLSKDRVTFHGFTRNLVDEYSRAMVFAAAPYSEPFGLTILEAMNAGLPVVTTRSGGPQEIVAEGLSGYLVDPGDHESMAHFIIYLLQNHNQAWAMGIEGHRRVRQHFSYETFIDKWKEVVRTV